ncbi:DsbA family protein [Bailinhaonella thermotolerans]|uniref:Disulfide bond formation protein DsbA n=1 Tax=Bailinhaonella thermotolerans TaxID=1070861 RepID=A0A3A4AVH1_9ACTN|nr:DsbA family protein [Bailinhaonella thermotolerans]RJL30067.1 disulfide bond formation protein DsbA [Bailinhaonella thermotolerans]
MRIEIWADMACAWAYIGKRRLEKALRAWDVEPVEVVWRPFRIDPTAPAPGVPMEGLLRDPLVDDALRACAPGLSPAANRARVSEIAAAEGIEPWTGSAWRASTHDAHRLAALAYEHGGAALQDAVVEEVLRAGFTEGLDLSRPEVLAAVAERAGFAAGAALLAAGGAGHLVRELLLTGKAMGVATSPTLVVNGRALAGAQAPETIREFLDDASRHVTRDLPAEVERFRRAESLLGRRDPLGALTLLRPLLDEHGEDRGLRLLAARAYYASAQLGRAAATLEGLVAENPDDSFARHLLGRTLQRQGRAAEAAPHLAMAAAMDPEYA